MSLHVYFSSYIQYFSIVLCRFLLTFDYYVQTFRGVSIIQHLHNVETFIPVDLKETVATITRPF